MLLFDLHPAVMVIAQIERREILKGASWYPVAQIMFLHLISWSDSAALCDHLKPERDLFL